MSSLLVVAIAAWVLLIVIWFGVSKAFRNADMDKIKSRLSGTAAKVKKSKDDGSKQLIHDEAKTGQISDLLKKYNLLPILHTLLEQAGLKWDPVKLIHSCLLAFVVCFGVTFTVVPGNLKYLGLIAGFAGASVPILYVMRLRKARLRRFEELFPESLEFVARSMRAGHAFSV